MKRHGWGTAWVALCFGCSHALPERVDLTRILDDLARRGASGEEVSKLASRMGRRVDPTDGLDLAEAETIALALAPSVRAARTAALGAEQVGQEAGRWPAPVLGIEALGVLNGGSPPVRLGLAVEFPIPLSDRLDAAVSAAGADRKAATLAAVVEEWRTVTEVRRSWIVWAAADRRAGQLEEHIVLVAPFLSAAEKLAKAGELEPDAVDLWRLTQKRHSLDAATARRTQAHARLELIALLGLPMTSEPRLTGSFELPPAPPTAVADRPEVRHALALVEKAAGAVRLAEAQKSGDLRIGPKVTYEEGATAMGGSIGIPLGSPDGARRLAAEARATHANAVVHLVKVTWDETVRMKLAATRAEAADQRLAGLREELAPLVKAQIERMQVLVASGEFSLINLRETLEQRLHLDEESLTAQVEAALARVEFLPVTVPPDEGSP